MGLGISENQVYILVCHLYNSILKIIAKTLVAWGIGDAEEELLLDD